MRSLTPRERRSVAMLLLVVAAGWYLAPGDAAPRESGSAFGDAVELGEAPRVRLDLLRAGADETHVGRDLFAYHVPQRPRTAPPVPPPIRDDPPPVVTPRVETRVVPVVASGPTAPRFSYIGLMGPKDGKIAVFDVAGAVLVAQVGELIVDGYELVSFGHESVVVRRASGTHAGTTVAMPMMG